MPPAATKVTRDVAPQVTTGHVTPIIADTTQHTKVTPLEQHVPT